MPNNSKTRNVLIVLAVAAAVLYAINAMRTVTIPLLIAFFLAYAMEPAISQLSKKTGRTPAVLILMCVVTIVVSLLVTLLVPMLQDIIATFTFAIPALLASAKESLSPITGKMGLEIPGTLEELASKIASRMQQGPGGDDLNTAGSMFKYAFSGTMGVISLALMLLLVPFFLFYFMRDYSRIIKWFAELIPLRMRDKVIPVMKELDNVLSHFIRGQLTVCAILAVLYSVILTIIGVQKGVGIGVMTGLFNIIPYGGIVVGLTLSLSFSLLNFHGWGIVIGCLVTYTVLPLVDNFFITPRVIGKSVGMNPVIIVVALLVGGQLLGVLGLLIAIPSAAVIRTLGHLALEAYRKSDNFKA
ncbi:MAG: AI-2E family transporter [Myxococcota bacterium]|jgi:predicted PurR-regulated permease PerM